MSSWIDIVNGMVVSCARGTDPRTAMGGGEWVEISEACRIIREHNDHAARKEQEPKGEIIAVPKGWIWGPIKAGQILSGMFCYRDLESGTWDRVTLREDFADESDEAHGILYPDLDYPDPEYRVLPCEAMEGDHPWTGRGWGKPAQASDFSLLHEAREAFIWRRPDDPPKPTPKLPAPPAPPVGAKKQPPTCVDCLHKGICESEAEDVHGCAVYVPFRRATEREIEARMVVARAMARFAPGEADWVLLSLFRSHAEVRATLDHHEKWRNK